MPGIAAKVFSHLQDWTPITPVITCPVAEVEVFALASAEAEVVSVPTAEVELNC